MNTNNKMLTAGIDIGSLTADAVIMQGGEKVLARVILPTGANSGAAARRAYKQVLASAGIPADAVATVGATGYGRDSVPFCHTGDN